MAPDDLSSQRDPRTDSSDEQAQMSVTTSERKGISPRNAPSQRRYGSQGKSHTELLKPPTRNQKKNLVCTVPNRQEMAALGSRHQQWPPEGKKVAQVIGTRKEEPPSVVSNTRKYDREEKLIIRISIQGEDGNERKTTALIDCGASENFIDRAYTEINHIPTREKTVPRRVLTVDRGEIASGPVTHDAQVRMIINHHEEEI